MDDPDIMYLLDPLNKFLGCNVINNHPKPKSSYLFYISYGSHLVAGVGWLAGVADG